MGKSQYELVEVEYGIENFKSIKLKTHTYPIQGSFNTLRLIDARDRSLLLQGESSEEKPNNVALTVTISESSNSVMNKMDTHLTSLYENETPVQVIYGVDNKSIATNRNVSTDGADNNDTGTSLSELRFHGVSPSSEKRRLSATLSGSYSITTIPHLNSILLYSASNPINIHGEEQNESKQVKFSNIFPSENDNYFMLLDSDDFTILSYYKISGNAVPAGVVPGTATIVLKSYNNVHSSHKNYRSRLVLFDIVSKPSSR